MKRVGVVGASGYAGAELLRLCAGHPEFDVVLATGESQAGSAVAALYPNLESQYGDATFEAFEASMADGLDLVFLALPHGASQGLMEDLVKRVPAVVDLAADFRLGDSSLYPLWYGDEHTVPHLLDQFVYGIPELFRESIVAASAVAAAGCYPTTSALALAPLVKAGLIETTGIIVDAASGVSGAGRAPKAATTFCTANENYTAYGLLNHRHTPEIEQSLARVGGLEPGAVSLLFTPHLAPMNRGILATCYARPRAGISVTSDELLDLYRETYDAEPFIVVTGVSPSTKATLGSNTAHITVRADERTGWIVAIAATDNLVKGASGQAIQCANIMLGLNETLGLPRLGVYP